MHELLLLTFDQVLEWQHELIEKQPTDLHLLLCRHKCISPVHDSGAGLSVPPGVDEMSHEYHINQHILACF